MNTSIGPVHHVRALERWLEREGNFAFSDSWAGLGLKKETAGPNVFCAEKTAGTTSMSKVRLGLKVIQNMEEFLHGYEK